MSRDYGKIRSSFWPDEKVQSWSLACRGFASYLLTSEHTTALGCFRLPLAYICADLKIPAGEARDYIKTLVESDWAAYDEKSGWIWIKKYINHNTPENGNVWKHVRRLAISMPASLAFRAAVLATIKPPGSDDGGAKPSRNSSETVSKASLLTEPNPTEPNRTEPSDADASGGKPPVARSFGDLVWERGPAYLENHGVPARQARTIIGRWRKERGDALTLAALIEAERECVSEPVAWIEGRFKYGGKQRKHGADASAERWNSILAGGLESIGYFCGEDGVWRGPDGQTISDTGGAGLPS